jgi:hypothetical protein
LFAAFLKRTCVGASARIYIEFVRVTAEPVNCDKYDPSTEVVPTPLSKATLVAVNVPSGAIAAFGVTIGRTPVPPVVFAHAALAKF